MAQTDPTSDFVLLGVPPTPFRDAYHVYLRAPLWASLLMIVVGFLLVNLLFAVAYWLTGGLANSSGSFADAFYFSVQTMGTIGYGAMYPQTPTANALVTAEAVAGLLVTAVSTGLVFAKISQPGSRIAFAGLATISLMDGQPTLQVRVGNERGNRVMQARLQMALTRTEVTAEGVTFYRVYDLVLVRDHTPSLARTWTILHHITPDSPLWGATPESLERDGVEIAVVVSGIDDTTLQLVQSQIRYDAADVRFGMRPADLLSELPDGRIQVDLTRFHELVPAAWASWDAQVASRL